MKALIWFWHMRRAWRLRARGDALTRRATALFKRAKEHEDAADQLYPSTGDQHA